MSFFRSKNIMTTFYVCGDKLFEINRYHDLGVVFQPNLLFCSHIEYICSKALRSLGFLIRSMKEFNNELCLKTFTPLWLDQY